MEGEDDKAADDEENEEGERGKEARGGGEAGVRGGGEKEAVLLYLARIVLTPVVT